MLISIWAKANTQQELDGAVRNKSIFEKTARCLGDAGLTRTGCNVG